jgi:hypothetical protein
MQSTGHASTHAVSLVPMQGSAITYAISAFSPMKSAAMNNKGAISSDWKQISYQQQRRRGKKRTIVPASEMALAQHVLGNGF